MHRAGEREAHGGFAIRVEGDVGRSVTLAVDQPGLVDVSGRRGIHVVDDERRALERHPYHVVPGQILPSNIVGMQTTVQGGTVEVTGSGDDLQVNGATVICGGVATANATVYLIDTVLLP